MGGEKEIYWFIILDIDKWYEYNKIKECVGGGFLWLRKVWLSSLYELRYKRVNSRCKGLEVKKFDLYVGRFLG